MLPAGGHTIKDAFSLVSEHVAKLTGKKVTINHIDWPKGISMIERRNFIGKADELKGLQNGSLILFEDGIDIIVKGFWREKLLIDLTYHTDQTGGLCAIEGGIDTPFDVLRVFTVSALKGSIRGEHAHKNVLNSWSACQGLLK